MDDDALNMSIRKFLKMVGVSSQREIERAVAEQSLELRDHRLVELPRLVQWITFGDDGLF